MSEDSLLNSLRQNNAEEELPVPQLSGTVKREPVQPPEIQKTPLPTNIDTSQFTAPQDPEIPATPKLGEQGLVQQMRDQVGQSSNPVLTEPIPQFNYFDPLLYETRNYTNNFERDIQKYYKDLSDFQKQANQPIERPGMPGQPSQSPFNSLDNPFNRFVQQGLSKWYDYLFGGPGSIREDRKEWSIYGPLAFRNAGIFNNVAYLATMPGNAVMGFAQDIGRGMGAWVSGLRKSWNPFSNKFQDAASEFLANTRNPEITTDPYFPFQQTSQSLIKTENPLDPVASFLYSGGEYDEENGVFNPYSALRVPNPFDLENSPALGLPGDLQDWAKRPIRTIEDIKAQKDTSAPANAIRAFSRIAPLYGAAPIGLNYAADRIDEVARNPSTFLRTTALLAADIFLAPLTSPLIPAKIVGKVLPKAIEEAVPEGVSRIAKQQPILEGAAKETVPLLSEPQKVVEPPVQSTSPMDLMNPITNNKVSTGSVKVNEHMYAELDSILDALSVQQINWKDLPVDMMSAVYNYGANKYGKEYVDALFANVPKPPLSVMFSEPKDVIIAETTLDTVNALMQGRPVELLTPPVLQTPFELGVEIYPPRYDVESHSILRNVNSPAGDTSALPTDEFTIPPKALEQVNSPGGESVSPTSPDQFTFNIETPKEPETVTAPEAAPLQGELVSTPSEETGSAAAPDQFSFTQTSDIELLPARDTPASEGYGGVKLGVPPPHQKFDDTSLLPDQETLSRLKKILDDNNIRYSNDLEVFAKWQDFTDYKDAVHSDAMELLPEDAPSRVIAYTDGELKQFVNLPALVERIKSLGIKGESPNELVTRWDKYKRFISSKDTSEQAAAKANSYEVWIPQEENYKVISKVEGRKREIPKIQEDTVERVGAEVREMVPMPRNFNPRLIKYNLKQKGITFATDVEAYNRWQVFQETDDVELARTIQFTEPVPKQRTADVLNQITVINQQEKVVEEAKQLLESVDNKFIQTQPSRRLIDHDELLTRLLGSEPKTVNYEQVPERVWRDSIRKKLDELGTRIGKTTKQDLIRMSDLLPGKRPKLISKKQVFQDYVQAHIDAVRAEIEDTVETIPERLYLGTRRDDVNEMQVLGRVNSEASRADDYSRAIVRDGLEGVSYSTPKRVELVISPTAQVGTDLRYIGNGDWEIINPNIVSSKVLNDVEDVETPLQMLASEYNAKLGSGLPVDDVLDQIGGQTINDFMEAIDSSSGDLLERLQNWFDDYETTLARREAEMLDERIKREQEILDHLDEYDTYPDIDPCLDDFNFEF